MDSLHSTMSIHRKSKHLSFEERVIIQTRLKDGYSLRAIARELHRSPSTISYEVKRGSVGLYHGKVKRYKATIFIKLIVKNVGANQTFSRKANSCTMSTNTSLKMAGRLTLAVIAALLWVNLPAAILSAPRPFIIMLTKAY